MFDPFNPQQRFREAWEAVKIVRSVPYTLFTFGESVLPYLLVCGDARGEGPVDVTKGEVRIARPMIITPQSARGEFLNFFENDDEEGVAQFLMTRTAQFSNLRLENQRGARRTMNEGVESAVAKLTKQLDDEEEDRVGILTAPKKLAGVAVLKFATERVMESTPGNIQELRERGFLPD